MHTVEKLDDTTYEVVVQGRTATTHVVTVPPAYAEKLAGKAVPVDLLVSRSFDFLLEREANTSILSRFELPVIARYFPEYERVIGGMLK